MICQTCTYYAGDSDDNLIRFVTGHHPNCATFSIDKQYFTDCLNRMVKSRVDNEVANLSIPLVDEQVVKEDRLSKKITKKLYWYLSTKHYPVIPNCYLYKWESDILAVTEKNYTKEFEVKISRSDFRADFRKSRKHQLMSDAFQYKFSSPSIPNYFYYTTPPGLLLKHEVPSYAGLVEVGLAVKIIKRAPRIHSLTVPNTIEKTLLKKCYHKFWYNY